MAAKSSIELMPKSLWKVKLETKSGLHLKNCEVYFGMLGFCLNFNS